MSIGSVVFSSYVLRKRNEMPKIKGKKIYKPHGFYSIKNTVGKVLSLRHRLPAGRAAPAHGAQAAPPLLPTAASGPGAVRTFRAASAQLGRCLFVSNCLCLFFCLFFFCFFCFVFLDIPRMEQETQNTPLPPMVSYCSFSERRSATGGKQRAGNHGVHKYMNRVVAGPAQQLLHHAKGVLGLLPPRPRQSRPLGARCRADRLPPCAGRCAPARCPAELPSVRKRGTRCEESAIIFLIVLFFCR